MFECVVCGRCTEDASVFAIPDGRGAIALCTEYCRSVFAARSWSFVPTEAETGEGD